MEEQRFGLKGALASGAAGLFGVGTGLSASAQEEDDTDAVVVDDASTASSGDTTVSVVDGVPTFTVEEEVEAEDDEAAEDEGAEDDGAEAEDDEAEDEEAEGEEVETEDETSEISADAGLSLVDASGGNNNFSFVS